MVQKEIIIKKVSKNGKEFEYTQTRLVYTEEEKQEKYKQKLADLREEHRREREKEEYENSKWMSKANLNDIFDAYSEFIDNVKNIDW